MSSGFTWRPEPETSARTMHDIIGYDQEKEKLKELVTGTLWRRGSKVPLQSNKEKPSLPANALLLVGPPGCGKTMMARSLGSFLGQSEEAKSAKQSKKKNGEAAEETPKEITDPEIMVYRLGASDLLSKWIGDSELRIKKVFECCGIRSPQNREASKESTVERSGGAGPQNTENSSAVDVTFPPPVALPPISERRPTMIILDDLDMLSDRDGSNTVRRIRTELIVQLSFVRPREDNFMFVGCTNVPWNLDDYLRRILPTRLFIGPPGLKTRQALFQDGIDGLKKSMMEAQENSKKNNSPGAAGGSSTNSLEAACVGVEACVRAYDLARRTGPRFREVADLSETNNEDPFSSKKTTPFTNERIFSCSDISCLQREVMMKPLRRLMSLSPEFSNLPDGWDPIGITSPEVMNVSLDDYLESIIHPRASSLDPLEMQRHRRWNEEFGALTWQ